MGLTVKRVECKSKLFFFQFWVIFHIFQAPSGHARRTPRFEKSSKMAQNWKSNNNLLKFAIQCDDFQNPKIALFFFHFWGIVQYTTHQKTNSAHAKSWQGVNLKEDRYICTGYPKWIGGILKNYIFCSFDIGARVPSTKNFLSIK